MKHESLEDQTCQTSVYCLLCSPLYVLGPNCGDSELFLICPTDHNYRSTDRSLRKSVIKTHQK